MRGERGLEVKSPMNNRTEDGKSMIDDMPDIFISNPDGTSHRGSAANEIRREKAGPDKTNAHKISLFASYCPSPQIYFKDLNAGEVVLLFLRRHFVTNVPWIVQGILLILLPIFIGIIINFLGISAIVIPPNLSLFSLLFYYLLVFEFFFLHFLNWFYNISLVTNQRIIDIDFRVLHSKHVAATKIVQIEDVSLNEVGIIRSVFDYGDVRVQTAGTAVFFEFLAVPHPEKIVDLIGDLIGGPNVP